MQENKFNLDEAIALLGRSPGAFDRLLRGLPDVWVRSNEGADSWNAFDIIGHLVHAERTDWMPRLQTILEHGETRPFPPFDRFAQVTNNRDKSLDELLDEFARLRAESLTALRQLNLQQGDLGRKGMHPALGQVTLGQLLATWTIHDVNHLHQLARVMAGRYRQAVGPWAAYLGVLQCDGHSAP